MFFIKFWPSLKNHRRWLFYLFSTSILFILGKYLNVEQKIRFCGRKFSGVFDESKGFNELPKLANLFTRHHSSCQCKYKTIFIPIRDNLKDTLDLCLIIIWIIFFFRRWDLTWKTALILVIPKSKPVSRWVNLQSKLAKSLRQGGLQLEKWLQMWPLSSTRVKLYSSMRKTTSYAISCIQNESTYKKSIT